jgi:hypothetical protein
MLSQSIGDYDEREITYIPSINLVPGEYGLVDIRDG